jgi:hypothetical protein
MSTRNRVIAFLVLAYALSTIFYVRIAAIGKLKMLPTLGLMWCPDVAALMLRLVFDRSLEGGGWRVRAPR